MEHFILKMIDKLPDMDMKINVRDYPQVRAYHPESIFGLTKYQALGFQIPWITVFCFHAKKSWETICNNFFFRENSWEPTFISSNVQKHVVKHTDTLKLKNIDQCVLLFTKNFNVY